MSDSQIHTFKALPEAPLEATTTQETSYNLEISKLLKIEASSAGYSFAGDIYTMLESDLAGCGAVDLHSIFINYKFSAEKQTIKAGLGPTHSSWDLDMIALRQGSLNTSSNAFTTLKLEVCELVVPNTFTRRLNTDASAPKSKLFLSASKGLTIQLVFRLIVHGPIIINSTHNLN
jgi:hypothetical protein